MTDNSAFKKQVRARMAEKGEKYTEARRKLLSDPPGGGQHPIPPAVAIDFPPESFTAVLGGGGMTNLALVMPHLIDFARKGHSVVIAAHEGRGRTWTLGSPFDFLVAGGAISPEDLVNRWTSGSDEDRDYLRKLLDEFPVTFLRGPQPAVGWESQLAVQNGKHAVLYVPDLNVDLPLSDWPSAESRSSLSSLDLMPAQLAGLKSVARQARAAVIGGSVDSWELVTDIVDAWIVFNDDLQSVNDGVRDATLEFYSRGSEDPVPLRKEYVSVDVSFERWRHVMAARKAA